MLEDPSAMAVARVYAEGFLNAVPADQAAGALEEFDSFISDVFDKNPDFAAALTSGMVNREKKVELIDRVLTGRASDLFVSFLRVLARHERLDLLPFILKQSRVQHEQRTGRQRVRVESAVPLSEATLQGIQQTLKGALPFDPIIEPQVDPTMLGGLRIRVGDTVYDNSLRTRIAQFRKHLRERSLHEIQSRRDRFSHPDGD